MRTSRALSIGVLVLIGCGGRSSLDSSSVVYVLPDGSVVVARGDGGGAADGAQVAEGGAPAEASDSSAADAGPTGDAKTDALAPFDASSAADATTSSDAAPADDSAVPDAATPRTIRCGATTCNANTEQCCVELGGGTTCSAIGACAGGVPLSCSGSESCGAGDVCCLTADPAGATSTCRATCNGGGAGGVELCSSDADCATGDRCRRTVAGISVCTRAAGAPGH
jgi:hypothetical protein